MRKFSFFAILLALPALHLMQAQESPDKLAPYYPTPMKVVDKMLELGGLKAGETMFDLGSGDGRIVIRAAEKYKAKSIGVEFDPSLAKQSQDRIKTLGLANLASIIQGDLLQQKDRKSTRLNSSH